MILPKVFEELCRRRSPNLLSVFRYSSKNQNPFSKTWNILARDIPILSGMSKKQSPYPEHADIVVIGGGFIGSSIAYWLKSRAGEGLNVVVLEKEPTYKRVQKNFNLGTLVQHFSLPENIHLAQYGAEFFRKAPENLNVDIQYCPKGQLVLATEKYADKLEHNVSVQKEFGIKNELLTPKNIEQRYPWINTKDIKLGCISREGEGSFNSWNLLKGLINKSQELGALYVKSEASGFELEQQRDVLMEGVAPGSYKRINKVIYTTPDGEEHAIKFAVCILAAGANSAEIAKLAKIGTGEGLLQVPLPIEQREEKIYLVEGLPMNTGLNTPIVMDTSGLWLAKEGLENNLLCGHIPMTTVNPEKFLEDEYYENIIKPSLINRVPDCLRIKVKKISSDFHDHNTYDESGILGTHPYHNNMYLATGFGKYGCQHAPGIGRAIAELIIDSHFTTIDLTRLHFDRLLTNDALVEFNVY